MRFEGFIFGRAFFFLGGGRRGGLIIGMLRHFNVSVVKIGPLSARKNSINPDTHREPARSSNIVRLLWRLHAKRSPHRRALVRIGQVHVHVLNGLEIYNPLGNPVVLVGVVAQGTLLSVQYEPAFLPGLDEFPAHFGQVAFAGAGGHAH